MPIRSIAISHDFLHGTDQEAIAVNNFMVTLVDEIVADGETTTMKGSYAALASAIVENKKGHFLGESAQLHI